MTIPSKWMTLPPPPPRKVDLESKIQRDSLARVNAIRGVRALRNNVGTITDHRGIPVTFGLGLGSADVVGVITFGGPNGVEDVTPALERTDVGLLAFAFGLEIKQPGRYRTRTQKAWAHAAERRGVRCGLIRSADDAEAWVRAEIARVARVLR